MSLTTNAYEQATCGMLREESLAYSYDANGNAFAWGRLDDARNLVGIAEKLAESGVRLCTITVSNKDKYAPEDTVEIAYHFDLDGTVLTLTLELPPGKRSVPSLMQCFANADWNEREFVELFDLEVTGREKPKRLFLDPELDKGVMNRLVPLSTMMNGASTKMLWEKVFSETTMPDWAKGEK